MQTTYHSQVVFLAGEFGMQYMQDGIYSSIRASAHERPIAAFCCMNPSVLLAHMLDAAASLLDDAVLCAHTSGLTESTLGHEHFLLM